MNKSKRGLGWPIFKKEVKKFRKYKSNADKKVNIKIMRDVHSGAVTFCLSKSGSNPGTDLAFFGSELLRIYSCWAVGFFKKNEE